MLLVYQGSAAIDLKRCGKFYIPASSAAHLWIKVEKLSEIWPKFIRFWAAIFYWGGSFLTQFLLLARYVPNVAKRSIWDQCQKKYILRTDRRPTDLSFGQYWGNFKWPYLRKGLSDPLHVWFDGGVFEVGGSNGASSFLTKFNGYVGENNAGGVIRLVTI